MASSITANEIITMKIRACLLFIFCLLPAFAGGRALPQYQYPFQDPGLPEEVRVTNIVSLMTLEEKAAFLSSHPGLPDSGSKPWVTWKGSHGLAQGGPANWAPHPPYPTTIFPGHRHGRDLGHERAPSSRRRGGL